MGDAQSVADKLRTGDMGDLRNTVSEAADQARQRAQEFGREAKDRIEQSRGPAADALDSTAETLRGSNVGPAARMADGLHSAADYVRSNDVGTMMSDLGSAIRNNPVPSLITAVALGFIIGAALNRD